MLPSPAITLVLMMTATTPPASQLPSNPCPAQGADPVFCNGFDNGDASLWSDNSEPLCSPIHGPFPPVPTDDILYAEWQSSPCFTDPCLCDEAARPVVGSLLGCDAVEGGYWWGLGSAHFRVEGRIDDRCVVYLADEIEGWVRFHRCHIPLPLQAWDGIETTDPDWPSPLTEGVEDFCTFVGACNLAPGGPDPCSEATFELILCPPAQSSQCDQGRLEW